MVEEQCHRDVEGRLLREARAPAACLRADDIEYRPCPYAGERHQQPMNVSALRQMSAHWDDLLDTLALLRVAYVEARGRAGAPLDVMDLWRIGQLASALPWWFVLGHGETCPAYAAALAKAAQGVGIWGQRVFVRTLTERWVPPVLTPQAIVELAEANGTLIAEAEVCAASDRMLRRFFEAMVESTPNTASAQLSRLAARQDRVLAFGAAYVSFKVALWIHYLARRFVYADLAATLRAEPGAPSPGAAAALAALADLLDASCEPGDFFVIGPTDLAGTAPAARAAWLGSLASHVVPFAPDGGDRPVQALAIQIALAGVAGGGELAEAIAAEAAQVLACSAGGAARVAEALAVYARLDALLGELIAAVEAGFRGATGGDLPVGAIDAATRDRVLISPPRAALVALAPVALAAACPA